jgi:hypothetical protein
VHIDAYYLFLGLESDVRFETQGIKLV